MTASPRRRGRAAGRARTMTERRAQTPADDRPMDGEGDANRGHRARQGSGAVEGSGAGAGGGGNPEDFDSDPVGGGASKQGVD